MTLVVALAGRHEVVIGAEQLCPLGDVDGQYGINYSKIRLCGDVAFGFAGLRSGVSLFDSVNGTCVLEEGKPLHDEIKKVIGAMEREYMGFKNPRDDIRLIACGVDKGEAMVYTAMFAHGGSFHPTHHTEGRAAIGLDKHGALHFLYTYHHLDMTTDELAFLAYFSIAETIRQDTRARGPIDVYVVREGSAIPLKQQQIEKLRDAAKEAKKKLGDALLSASPALQISSS